MSEGRELTPREHLLLDVRISVCYYNRRRAFLESFDRTAKAIAILGGSVAISRLFGNSEVAVAIAGAVVIFFSTVNLVCATSQAATRAHDLERRFVDLEREILSSPEENFTELAAEKFSDKLLTITTSEPPYLIGLYAICYNSVFRAAGFGKKYYLKLKWYQHPPFAHFVDINPESISPPTVRDFDFPKRIS